MRRRELLRLGAVALAAAVRPAFGQSLAAPVIGVILLVDADSSNSDLKGFMTGLADGGYIPGQNVRLEVRSAGGDSRKLAALAQEMVERRVSVIATQGGLVGAQAAKAAAKSTPVVFVYGGDPVRDGIVESFNRPGRNLTGVTFLSNVLAGKRLEWFHDVAPQERGIAVLSNPRNADSSADLAETLKVAASLQLSVLPLRAGDEREIDAAFKEISLHGIRALFISADGYLGSKERHLQIVQLAAQGQIATCVPNAERVRSGALTSYSDDRVESLRQWGLSTARVLAGAEPATFPIVQPTKLYRAINLKTAAALGLIIPRETLLLADEVLE